MTKIIETFVFGIIILIILLLSGVIGKDFDSGDLFLIVSMLSITIIFVTLINIENLIFELRDRRKKRENEIIKGLQQEFPNKPSWEIEKMVRKNNETN